MEWLISGSNITWCFMQERVSHNHAQKTQTGEGETRGSDRHGEKNKQRERRGRHDMNHDTHIILQGFIVSFFTGLAAFMSLLSLTMLAVPSCVSL